MVLILDAAPPAPLEKSDAAAQFKAPRISLAYKDHGRKTSIAAGQPKLPAPDNSLDKEIADELLSRTAASKIPLTGMSGRFMVPAGIANRWKTASIAGDMLQILHDRQAFQLSRQKNPL